MDYSAANTELWAYVFQLGLIAGAILLAGFAYRRIRHVRKLMMPVAVLAGFLLLIAKYLGVPLREDIMEILVFHGLALGFIAMSLRIPPDRTKNTAQGLTGLKSGAIIVSTYLVQGITGLIISLLLANTLFPDLFKVSGLLLPMGYGQGPGQANNVGSTYEALGFEGGRSYGMSIAAAGYLVACTVGVVILNVLRQRGKLQEPGTAERDDSKRNYFEDQALSSVSASIDVLSVQAAWVLFVYLITYLVTWGLTAALGALAPGLSKTISPLIWGFNFIVGSALGMGLRAVLTKYKRNEAYALRYQNNYLLNRISGFFFDIMIVAGIASINIEDLKGLWIPFIITAVAGGVMTWLHLKTVCKKVYHGYYYQGLLSMFGMLTGTISSGILLLREIDPELSTPAANNLITGSSFGIILGAPMLVLVSLAVQSDTMCFVTLGIMAAYLAVLNLLIFRLKAKGASHASKRS